MYGYCGNDPGNRWDPSGYLQDGTGDFIWGIGAGSVAVVGAGAIIVATGGAALPVIAIIGIGIGAGMLAGAISEAYNRYSVQ